MKKIVCSIAVAGLMVSGVMAKDSYFTLGGGALSGDLPSQTRYSVALETFLGYLSPKESNDWIFGMDFGLAYGSKDGADYFDTFADIRPGYKIGDNMIVYGIGGLSAGSWDNDGMYGGELGAGFRFYFDDYRYTVGVDYKYGWFKDDSGLDPTMSKVMGVIGIRF